MLHAEADGGRQWRVAKSKTHPVWAWTPQESLGKWQMAKCSEGALAGGRVPESKNCSCVHAGSSSLQDLGSFFRFLFSQQFPWGFRLLTLISVFSN